MFEGKEIFIPQRRKVAKAQRKPFRNAAARCALREKFFSVELLFVKAIRRRSRIAGDLGQNNHDS